MIVSRLWYAEAEARLYSAVQFDSLHKHYEGLIAAVTVRKHHIRRVAWSHIGGETAVPELLDILLDYRPDEHEAEMTGQPPTLPVVFPLGPNRPALTHLSYHGNNPSWQFFDSVLFSLMSLVSLDLLFYQTARAKGAEGYHMDMGRILATFPHLKHLGITGWIARYVPPTTTLSEDYRGSIHAMSQEESGEQCRLESFTFYPGLMGKNGRDASLFFRRLGNLKKIFVLPHMSNFGVPELGRPWNLDFCPKLESIEARGSLALWIFDLPIVPYYKMFHLTSLAGEPSPQDIEGMSDVQVQEMTKKRQIQRLQDQEVGELLEGKGADPFFPQLQSLILGQDHCLSAQDLISLGVQARFLTDLEIQVSSDYNVYWEMYDLDAAGFHPTAANYSLIDKMKQLRIRRQFTSRDLMLFLQVCSSLVRFSMTKHSILFEDLLVDNNDKAVIQPWACEGTLESLTIGFDLLANQPKDHALVWSHLGRFKKLRSLSFPHTLPPSKKGRSGLVPCPVYGVESLLTGRGGRGMSATLEEIGCLSSWWKVNNRREMVLWFAESFPKLRVLGLEYHQEYVRGAKQSRYTGFLKDKEVMSCSISRIFFKS
ncbi:hypothetical protein BGZ96_011559 [Linnemannia gamsii]|uniref:Uncharacterized protein n=1 Tax=Linnemannia gamsii TaxID=64522 RepID=A0ABQ7JSD7_9FUNG|nr:hypothetical protein BGZ96_011559 [Linnemannia gamsii]